MKKMGLILCFVINTGLVVASGGETYCIRVDWLGPECGKYTDWLTYGGIVQKWNYVMERFMGHEKLMPTKELLEKAISHCFEDPVQDLQKWNEELACRYQQTCRMFFKFGRHTVTLKDVIEKSTAIEKCGYACIVVFAVYGAVQFAFGVRNKFRKGDDQQFRSTPFLIYNN